MKKKTLAAASLLLALLMPLGVTPLAVYADEGEGTTQGETSNASEDSGEKDNGNTNEDSEGTGNGNTNDGSEAGAPKAKEETVAPVLLDAADTGLDDNKTFSPDAGDILNKQTGKVYAYADFEQAVKEAKPKDELELGIGTYSLYDIDSADTTKDKILTFTGQGPDKTIWRIGAEEYQGKGGEHDSDYSFQGSQSVTFKKMKLRVPYNENYLGFSHTNVTVVEDCVIEGRTAYWGYKSAMFKNTTFNAPSGDYAIWTYSSPEMTFDNCTFNASGKVINVYTDFDAGKNNIIVNFNNCTVNSTKENKTALSINDSSMTKAGKGFRFFVNITGNNTINGLKPDTKTCSRLFGFSNDKIDIYGNHYDSGSTVVKIQGITVWERGVRTVGHNGNNFATGSYDNDTGSGSDNRYTDGYKDGQVYKVYGDWSNWTEDANVPHLFHRTRTVNEECHYCSYDEPLDDETETENAYLLHYDLNGGTPAESADYSDHYYFKPIDGNTATVAADPSRAGYQFAGWQDAAGNQYAAGNTVTVDRDITLTAQWNKLVTVSFDLCGHGGANIPSQTFVSGNKASEPTAPKEDGWVFGGWYTEKGCKYRFSFDSAVTSDITLYAKWDRVTTVVSAPVATPTPTSSPAPAAAATKTATVKNAAIPQTSDVFPMEGLLALLAVGAVGFGAAGWLRKKHH